MVFCSALLGDQKLVVRGTQLQGAAHVECTVLFMLRPGGSNRVLVRGHSIDACQAASLARVCDVTTRRGAVYVGTEKACRRAQLGLSL